MTSQTATDSHFLTPAREGMEHLGLRIVASPDVARIGSVVYVAQRAVRVGRDPGPEAGALLITDAKMSRHHAELRWTGADLIVTDKGSKNGTFVDGHPADRAVLSPGSVLRIGGTLFVVEREAITESDDDDLGLVGVSAAIAEVRETIRRVARSLLPVLVSGPTGTGKELVARALHARSGRRGAFVPINCAALPETLVESTLFGHTRGAYTGATDAEPGAFLRADKGTLFLDEVGEMALSAQPKLLRVLESGEVTAVGSSRTVKVDVRVVAATNVSLGSAVPDGRFREDLYGRIAGVEVQTPALADRPEDLLQLFQALLDPALGTIPLDPDAAEALLIWEWPRNVRELKRLAERLPVLHPKAPSWTLEMLPEALRVPILQRTAASPPPVERVGKAQLTALLARHHGNVTEAASEAGLSRRHLYRLMDDFGLGRGTGRR